MGLTNTRYAVVNRSNETIPVYEKLVSSEGHVSSKTVGGEQIGEIAPDDFYTVTPNDSPYITYFKVRFLDYDGNVSQGYIETSRATTYPDYEWKASQEPYHYYNSDGSGLVEAKTETIGGKKYRIFTVCNKALVYRNSAGTRQGTLEVGTKLAALDSTTGETYGGYMAFYRKKVKGGSWEQLVAGANYGFVDLGMAEGVSPSNRCIQ